MLSNLLQWVKIERNINLNQKQLEDLKTKKLHDIVQHAYNNTPYYKQLLDKKGKYAKMFTTQAKGYQ